MFSGSNVLFHGSGVDLITRNNTIRNLFMCKHEKTIVLYIGVRVRTSHNPNSGTYKSICEMRHIRYENVTRCIPFTLFFVSLIVVHQPPRLPEHSYHIKCLRKVRDLDDLAIVPRGS